jgi:hypothetical protein
MHPTPTLIFAEAVRIAAMSDVDAYEFFLILIPDVEGVTISGRAVTAAPDTISTYDPMALALVLSQSLLPSRAETP